MIDAADRSGNVRKVLAVAWREFKYTALTKAFLFGAVVVPFLIFVVIAVAPSLMRQDAPPLKGTIAIVDPSGLVAPEATKDFGEMRAGGNESANPATMLAPNADPKKLADAMTRPKSIDIAVEATKDQGDTEKLRDRVRTNELLALAIIDPKLVTKEPGDTQLELYVPTGSSPIHTDIYIDVLRAATVRARVKASGENYEAVSALIKRPQINTQRVSKEGGTAKERLEARMIIPIGFMMLLWISTFTSGNYLLTTTIEEKSNKVMEVLLSAVSPMQLLFGKILGQGLVSLVMLVIYGGVGMAGISLLAMMDLIQPSLVAYLVLYFVMAYFMIAAIMAAVGSAVSDLREAQALVTPAMLMLMVPLMLWLPISQNPNGALATVTSFVPPLIPFVMILRVSTSTEPVALWQVLASLAVGFVATVGMIWLAARIFRVGVLMQGKPPTPMELIRWAGYK
ncbi:MAG: ABC transporter permease [Phycisphaerales bacterium]